MTLKIVAISDTHTNSLQSLPNEVLKEIEDADWIVHAGDYTGRKLVEELMSLGKFKGVYGNMDPPSVRSMLSSVEVLTVGKYTIGVCHPSEGGPPFNIESRIAEKFEKVDAIIYGHTHVAKSSKINNIIFLNPGSATGAWPATRRTYGVLKIDDEIKPMVIKI